MGYQITNTGYGISDNPCKDKATFLTEKAANAAKIQAKWEHDTEKLKVYLCDKCGLYHLATDRDDGED
jgi:hypothetical protein